MDFFNSTIYLLGFLLNSNYFDKSNNVNRSSKSRRCVRQFLWSVIISLIRTKIENNPNSVKPHSKRGQPVTASSLKDLQNGASRNLEV